MAEYIKHSNDSQEQRLLQCNKYVIWNNSSLGNQLFIEKKSFFKKSSVIMDVFCPFCCFIGKN